MWTYYKYVTLTDIVLLYREDESHRQEVFHLQECRWKASSSLLSRQANLEIDSQDIISEQEAEALVQSLSSRPKK